MITAESARLRAEKYKQTRPYRELDTAISEIDRSASMGYYTVEIKITYEQNKKALEDKGFILTLIPGENNRGFYPGTGYFIASWEDINEKTVDNSITVG